VFFSVIVPAIAPFVFLTITIVVPILLSSLSSCIVFAGSTITFIVWVPTGLALQTTELCLVCPGASPHIVFVPSI